MVDITLPGVITEEFISLIPKQRATVNRLMEEKVVLAYSLSLDRSKLWAVIRAETESEVFDTLSEFPLIGWMRFDVYELAFNDNAFSKLSYLSWN